MKFSKPGSGYSFTLVACMFLSVVFLIPFQGFAQTIAFPGLHEESTTADTSVSIPALEESSESLSPLQIPTIPANVSDFLSSFPAPDDFLNHHPDDVLESVARQCVRQLHYDCNELKVACRFGVETKYQICYYATGGDPFIHHSSDTGEYPDGLPYQKCAGDRRLGLEVCDLLCEILEDISAACDNGTFLYPWQTEPEEVYHEALTFENFYPGW
jgi:hypothetical protein